MHGQSSAVKVKDLLVKDVKDPYTGSIFMHAHSAKHTGLYNVHLPRIIRN